MCFCSFFLGGGGLNESSLNTNVVCVLHSLSHEEVNFHLGQCNLRPNHSLSSCLVSLSVKGALLPLLVQSNQYHRCVTLVWKIRSGDLTRET